MHLIANVSDAMTQIFCNTKQIIFSFFNLTDQISCHLPQAPYLKAELGGEGFLDQFSTCGRWKVPGTDKHTS